MGCTDSSALGREAPASKQEIVHHAPGGLDSVDLSSNTASGCGASADVLLARPAVGGASTLVLGGADSDWVTSSATHDSQQVIKAAEAFDHARRSPEDTLVMGASVVVPSIA